MDQDLLLIDHTGKVLRAPIFTPLLRVLHPAFLANAEGIRINHSRLKPQSVSASYIKSGRNTALKVEPDFQWPDLFARLKIIAGISIADGGHQTGEIALQFQNRAVPARVEITENEEEQTVDLKLELNQ